MRKFLLTLSVICLTLTSAILFSACGKDAPPATVVYKQLAYYENGRYYQDDETICNYYEASNNGVKSLSVKKEADEKFNLVSYVKTEMKKSGFTLLENKTYAGITYQSEKNVYVYEIATNEYVIVEESAYPRYEQETLVNFFSANREEGIKCTYTSSTEHEHVIGAELTLNPSSISVAHLHTKDETETYNYKTYDGATNEFEYTLDGDDSFSIFVKISGISLVVRDNSGSGITYTFK